ncbi:hypothetical protein QZH41_018701 [Actinostola sp. cb2023]|nr:hypothetical protein QZH41_018701 [Actinostola sp. cb2023]
MTDYLRYLRALPSFIYGVLCICAIVVWILFATLTLPFYFLFRMFKFIQGKFVSYHNLGNLLSSKDVPFLHESKSNRNYINGLFVIDGKPDIDQFRHLLMERIILNYEEPSYVRMRQLVVKHYGRYVWQAEDDFDIKKHVVLYDGSSPCNEAELQETLGALASSPIPEDISPWLFVIVPLNMEKEQFAACVRIHHILGDGFALVGLIARIVDRKPELLRVQKPVATPCDKQKQVWQAVFTGPLALLSVALAHSTKNPFSTKVKLSGEKVFSWTKPVSMDKIKEIKALTGTTINDVVSSCIAGALRRYLKSEGLDDPSDMQIAVTINTRPRHVLSKDSIPLENHSTGLLCSLPVGIVDPIQRIYETKHRMDDMKASSDWKVFGWIFYYVLGTLPESIGRFSSYSLNRHCCLILSNVPGPLRELELNGSAIESVIAWPPLMSDTSMSISVFSYAGKLRMSVMTDKAVICNPTKLTDVFMDEFNDMYEKVKTCQVKS